MKIVAISDLHGSLPKLPACDVVCISGDIVPLKIQSKTVPSIAWLARDFKAWTDSLDCKVVVMIGGNHDFVLEALQTAPRYYSAEEIDYILFGENSKIVYLQDNIFEYEGKVFYGTPWCPNLRQWAFYAKDPREKFKAIPDTHIDVLLTHCPPMIGTQGKVLQGGNWNFEHDFGCPELTEILKEKDVDWVISGHIHSGNHGVEKFGKTNYVNVSLKNEDYVETYNAFEFEI